AAQLLDLRAQALELVLTALALESLPRSEDALQAPGAEPFLDALGDDRAVHPSTAGGEPPRLAAIGIDEIADVRKAPRPELGQHERLGSRTFRRSVGAERRRGRCDPLVEPAPHRRALIGQRPIPMEVVQRGTQMERGGAR